MGASQIEVGDMYVSQTGIFARDVLGYVGGALQYQQYDYPEGRPRMATSLCTAESLWRWAGRRLDDREADRVRAIGRPNIREEQARQDQSLWAAIPDVLMLSEFMKRNMVARLFELANVNDDTLRQSLAQVPDDWIVLE